MRSGLHAQLLRPAPTRRVRLEERRRDQAGRPRVVRRAHAGPHHRPPLPARPRGRLAALRRPRAAHDHAAHLRRGRRRATRSSCSSTRSTRSPRSTACDTCCPPTATRSTTCPVASRRSRRTTTSAGEAARRVRSRSARPRSTELSHHLFRKERWGGMAESETYAHLEHLRLSGQAESPHENGH